MKARTYRLRRLLGPILIGPLSLMLACVERGDDVLGNETLEVLGTTPANGELHVAPDAVIAVRFDRALDLRTLDQDSLRVLGPDGVPLRGWSELDLGDHWLHFHPAQLLEAGVAYRAVVSQTILDYQGFGFRETIQWRWVVEGSQLPLALTGLYPSPKTDDAPADSIIELQFDQALDRNSLYDAFEIQANGEDWGFRVDTDASRADWVRLVPEPEFEPGAWVQVRVSEILGAGGESIESIEFDFRIDPQINTH